MPSSRGIFPTQGSNPGLLHCRQILYHLSHQGSPRILEWEPIPSPGGLPDPGINLGSPALQADSLPTEVSGKQLAKHMGKWSAYLVIQGMQIKTTATFAPMKDFNNDNAVFVQHGMRYIGNPWYRHAGKGSDPFGKKFDAGYQKLKYGIPLSSINPLLVT